MPSTRRPHSPRLEFASKDEERLHLKQRLAAAFRLFGRFGFDEGVAGHITVRDPEFPELFWVNPFAVSFRHIRVSDLILVDHDGNVVYGTRPVNRAAFVIHSAVHQARPDVVAAAHSHSVHGKAFSSLGIPLAPITQDSCIFYEDHVVVTAQRGRVQFGIEDGRELVAQFPTGKAAIHQNHGLLTAGRTVCEAFVTMHWLEKACQAQVMAMACNTELNHLSEEVIAAWRSSLRQTWQPRSTWMIRSCTSPVAVLCLLASKCGVSMPPKYGKPTSPTS